MFLAILFIILGVSLLLNAMGVIGSNFWGFFWAIVLIVAGVKMMMKKGNCPMCGWWSGKINEKINGHCCEGHDHEGQSH